MSCDRTRNRLSVIRFWQSAHVLPWGCTAFEAARRGGWRPIKIRPFVLTTTAAVPTPAIGAESSHSMRASGVWPCNAKTGLQIASIGAVSHTQWILMVCGLRFRQRSGVE